MCTMTLLRIGPTTRLCFNRDERHARPAALPPALIHLGLRRVMMPIDPQSGGSWIGVNDAGVIACLLNANPMPSPAMKSVKSRGFLVPGALEEDHLDAAVDRMIRLHAGEYPPFRLMIAQEGSAALIHNDGKSIHVSPPGSIGRPLMLASSGLGDALVDAPRRLLWARCIQEGGISPQAQDSYHRHRWSHAPQLSVNMRRADARTVSHCRIELDTEIARMIYHAGAPDEPGADRQTTLPLSRRMAVMS